MSTAELVFRRLRFLKVDLQRESIFKLGGAAEGRQEPSSFRPSGARAGIQAGFPLSREGRTETYRGWFPTPARGFLLNPPIPESTYLRYPCSQHSRHSALITRHRF